MQDHYGKDPENREVKEELANIHASQKKRQEQVPSIQSVIVSVNTTNLTLHYKSTWNG